MTFMKGKFSKQLMKNYVIIERDIMSKINLCKNFVKYTSDGEWLVSVACEQDLHRSRKPQAKAESSSLLTSVVEEELVRSIQQLPL